MHGTKSENPVLDPPFIRRRSLRSLLNEDYQALDIPKRGGFDRVRV
jgi:hypothetical protein